MHKSLVIALLVVVGLAAVASVTRFGNGDAAPSVVRRASRALASVGWRTRDDDDDDSSSSSDDDDDDSSSSSSSDDDDDDSSSSSSDDDDDSSSSSSSTHFSPPVRHFEITFAALWTVANGSEPDNPHFSPLVGAAHSEHLWLAKTGSTASPGIEAVAETGNPTTLLGELTSNEHVANVFNAGRVLVSPSDESDDTFVVTVAVDRAHAFVSGVSMLAPSPDWFTKFRFDLSDVNEVEMNLFAYDAGTDDGETFTAEDADTDPKGTIERIGDDGPFGDEPVAHVSIKCVNCR